MEVQVRRWLNDPTIGKIAAAVASLIIPGHLQRCWGKLTADLVTHSIIQ
jgi:hypothetical protein